MKQLINKATIISEIKRRIDRNNEMAASFSSNSEHDYLCRVTEKVYKNLLSFLDTLEVKEVDLEEEFYDFLDTLTGKDNGHLSEDELFRIAEYFYELGLKTKENKL